ncbi:MAG: hypothetical protein JNL08_00165 [Planctomycetes bacterium]|nr:hypothetical protein [Planctomycetota bacterium]
MRLDPVFVVAPEPTAPTMPTRRAFLLAGATFTFGAAIGGACGYSAGAAQAAGSAAPREEELTPSGDSDLDELRRLAVKAPIEELIERRLVFLRSVGALYRRDDTLWRGVVRLSEAVRSRDGFPDRLIIARLIAQNIEQADADFARRFEALGREMRQIR